MILKVPEPANAYCVKNENDGCIKVQERNKAMEANQWKEQAKTDLQTDLEKPVESLLQDVYEQRIKLQDHGNKIRNNQISQHIPEEIRAIIETKTACIKYRLSKKDDKRTKSLIRLTYKLMFLTIALVVVAIASIFTAFSKPSHQINNRIYNINNNTQPDSEETNSQGNYQ